MRRLCVCCKRICFWFTAFYVKHESNLFKPVKKLKRQAGEFSDFMKHLLCQCFEQLRDIFPGGLHSVDV